MKLFPGGCHYRYKHYNQKVNAVERANLLNQVFQSNGRNKIWGAILPIFEPEKVLYTLQYL